MGCGMYKWKGVDANPAISLYDYGVVCKREKGDNNWRVICRVNPNEYIFSSISEEDLKNIFINDGWAKDYLQPFLMWAGTTWLEWLDESFYNKIMDVISFFGPIEILGTPSNGTMNVKEVEKITNIK